MSTGLRSTAPTELVRAEAAELSAQQLVLDHTASGVQELVTALAEIQRRLPEHSEHPTVAGTFDILELLLAASQSVAESLEVLADGLATNEVPPP